MSRFRFDEFEFDAGSGELRRVDGTGAVERLAPQPARLLELLAERQGAVVTREEIRERIWPDTHVDFDTSLHFCVRQVRTALGDSGAEPRYLQNVPRRGYRLMPAVTQADQPAPTLGPAPDFGRRALLLALALIGTAVGIALLVVTSDEGQAPVRIGIMPFEPPADRREGWQPIAEWILEDLMAAAGGSAAIVGPTSTAAYAGSDDRLRDLAADYHLEYIVNGRFLDAKGGPRMLAELIRVSDGAHVWVRGYNDLGDGRLIGTEISRNVARELAIARP